MDESRWVLLYGSERIRAVTPPTGLSSAALLKPRPAGSSICGPVGMWSTQMTLELRRRMETPSKGRDLSLYAMLFQEVTTNRSDPPNRTARGQ